MSKRGRCRANGGAIPGLRPRPSEIFSGNSNEPTCHKCGLVSGEVDWTTGLIARLHPADASEMIGAKKQAADGEVVCSICEEGARMITTIEKDSEWLVYQVQQAGSNEQLAVLSWLRSKFEDAGQAN